MAMFASSGPTAKQFNRWLLEHQARVDRILVVTVDQINMPPGLSYEHSGDWIREYCLRHNCTYYARPRETFSETEAREQAVRENKNTVIVEDLS